VASAGVLLAKYHDACETSTTNERSDGTKFAPVNCPISGRCCNWRPRHVSIWINPIGRTFVITEQGFEVIEQMIIISTKINDRILRNISAEHKRITEDVLYTVKQNLKEVLTEIARQGPPDEFGSQLLNTTAPLL